MPINASQTPNTKSCASDGSMNIPGQEKWLKNCELADALFKNEHLFWIATDKKGIIQVFNPGAERMLGYTAAEVVAQLSVLKVFDPEQLLKRAVKVGYDIPLEEARGFNSLVYHAARDQQDGYRLRKIRKDGSNFLAIGSVLALRDAQDAVFGYLFFGQDYTASRNLEQVQAQALVESEQHAQRVLDTASDPFVSMNAKGDIIRWNIKAQALFGWTREEVLGKSLRETIVAPCSRDSHRRGLAHFLATGESWVLNRLVQVRAVRRDGSEIPIELNTWAVNTVNGYEFNAFLHDLTERRQAESRKLAELVLVAKNVELERSSRMKSEFLATMSHELRTPLNAIIGFSEILKDGLISSTSALQQEYASDIFSSGQHLLSLINDILDLSKIEAGKMDLVLEPVNLKDLLTHSVSVVKEKALAQRIKLVIDIAEDLGRPQLDSRKIKQILYNLLANAIKFTPSGGLVTLRAKRVLRSEVGVVPGPWPTYGFPFTPSEHEEFVEICVKDTGLGVSSRNINKLFQAFRQIDGSITRSFEGTGLGLAMVKQLTELHGGCVAVASQEKEGSRFVVWLPLCEPDPELPSTAADKFVLLD